MKIGEKLRIARKKLGMNQDNFASKLKISLKTYQNYESNTYPVKLEIINKLIKNFSVNPNWLFINQKPVFLNETEEGTTSFEQTLKEAYNLTDGEISLFKEELLCSPATKKAIFKSSALKPKNKKL